MKGYLTQKNLLFRCKTWENYSLAVYHVSQENSKKYKTTKSFNMPDIIHPGMVRNQNTKCLCEQRELYMKWKTN